MGCLLFINGKPRSGKDTVGQMILNLYHGRVAKMTDPIDRAFKATFGLTDEEFRTLREDLKDKATVVKPGLLPFTLREFYIRFSEDFLKGLAGQGCFGAMAADAIWEDVRRGVVVVTDCGFNSEVAAIMARRPDDIPLEQVWGLRVMNTREANQQWDSREPIIFHDHGFLGCLIENGGTIEELDDKVRDTMAKICVPIGVAPKEVSLRQKNLFRVYGP